MGICAIRAQVTIGFPNGMIVIVQFGAKTGSELCQHSTGPAGEKGFGWVNFRGGTSKNLIVKQRIFQSPDDVDALTCLPCNCRGMCREGEGRVKGDAKKLRVVLLRDADAVESDWREATEFLIPRGEEGHH